MNQLFIPHCQGIRKIMQGGSEFRTLDSIQGANAIVPTRETDFGQKTDKGWTGFPFPSPASFSVGHGSLKGRLHGIPPSFVASFLAQSLFWWTGTCSVLHALRFKWADSPWSRCSLTWDVVSKCVPSVSSLRCSPIGDSGGLGPGNALSRTSSVGWNSWLGAGP